MIEINKKVKIPPENETKVKIITLSQAFGCYNEVKEMYNKFDEYYKQYQFDEMAKFQLAKSFIAALSKININLISWLADEKGDIRVNNIIVFTLYDDGKDSN